VGKSVEKRPFGRNGGRWKDNIRMDLTEIGWEGVDRWRALVNTVMKLRLQKMRVYLD
jgi:hypothetical protein